MGTKQLSNGTPLPDKAIGAKTFANKIDCSLSIRLIEVNCNGDNHSPSQYAQCVASEKPYYVVEITEVCPSGGQPPKGFPNMGFYDGGGDSGGSTTSSEMSIQDSFNYMLNEAGFPELSSNEYTYIQNNQYIGGQLLSYFYNNLNQNNTQLLHWSISYFNSLGSLGTNTITIWKEFESQLNFAQQFFANNPNTSWEKFENWFLTKSEGPDGEPVDNLDDILNTIQYQNKQMPTYSQFVGAFPKLEYPGYPGYFKQMPASQIYPMVGGNLEYLYNSSGKDIGPYRNACTVRFSLAMNRLGFYIPNNSLSRKGADENGQPRYYYLQAKTAGDFMSKTFGSPTHILEGTDANNPDKVAKFLEGKTGIYVIVNNNSTTAGYTGHVDLIQNGHIPGGANANNVPGGIKSIRIWEFKP